MTGPGESVTIRSPLTGWVTPLDALPDPVFAGRIMGDGVAIDPVGGLMVAPFDGELLSVHAAKHAFALRTTNGAELLVHLGIDSVALGGRGMEVLAAVGGRVEAGQPLLRFDLDALVTEATAAMTPVIVTNGDLYQVEVIAAGLVAAGDPLLRVSARSGAGAGTGATTDDDAALTRQRMAVALPHGVHARPAARLAAALRDLSAQAWIVAGGRRAAVSSSISLLGLGIAEGDTVTIEASGPDADAAIARLGAIIGDAHEAVSPPPPTPQSSPAAPDGPGLRGVAAAPGLAIGRAWRLPELSVAVDETGGDPATEATRFEDARVAALHALAAQNEATGAARGVLAAHAAFLEDPDLLAATQAAITAGQPAPTAWRRAIGAQADALAASPDRRIAERAQDLRDIERRVLAAMAGEADAALAIPAGSILIAPDLLPSQVIALDPAQVVGIALNEGGATSHAAILAAGNGIPMIVALGEALDGVTDGTTLLLDADRAALEVDPPAERLTAATNALERRAAANAAARDAVGHTADGVRIEVLANLGSAEDAEVAVANGAEGCGLLRTEFLFLDRATPPDEAEQHALYQRIADTLGERPLTVRLLDIGGDKPAPYLGIAAEENPALGLRGVRVVLQHPDILATQLSAIAAVTPSGRCRIMVPMIATVAEFDAMRVALEKAVAGLGVGERPALGTMVETPAAALIAPELARRADFLSIGTNDLTQYALAMDRGNAAVARDLDGLHPAVLRLIAATCDGARTTGIPVGVCGGLAADRVAMPILIGLGVTSLSVPPALVPATKAAVATLTVAACRDLAGRCLAAESAAAVRTLVGAAS